MTKHFFTTSVLLLLIGCLMTSCSSYKQNIMFKVPEDRLKNEIAVAEKNYTIQANDLLSLEVYTNSGERLIDPEDELSKDNKIEQSEEKIIYEVNEAGVVKLPMIGDINLTGLTLRSAEELLQKEYAKFYKSPYVMLKFESKRVIVLGASGGQVIPLSSSNMMLVEILALAKGITNDGKAHNLRVIRNNEVMVADLSTFEGYQKYNVPMQSGDVVYIEPVRKPFAESLRDYAPLITMLTSLTTLIVVIAGL